MVFSWMHGYIYSMQHDQYVYHCAIKFFSVIEALKLVTIEVESNFQIQDDSSLDQSPMTTFTTYTISPQ